MEKENKNSHASREITYEQFYDKYFFRFVDYCNTRVPAGESEDIVEDALAALWKHWDKLESHTERVLFVWCKKAIALLIKAYYRKRAKKPTFVEFHETLDKECSQNSKGDQIGLEEIIVENETYQYYLVEIKRRLSFKEGQLFDCIFINKMSVRETAAYLSMTEKAISVSVFRLRAKLRDRILPEVIPKEFMAKR